MKGPTPTPNPSLKEKWAKLDAQREVDRKARLDRLTGDFHKDFKQSTEVYVVGMSQTGGCWSSMRRAFKTYENAHAHLREACDGRQSRHAIGNKIFTFEVYEQR